MRNLNKNTRQVSSSPYAEHNWHRAYNGCLLCRKEAVCPYTAGSSHFLTGCQRGVRYSVDVIWGGFS